jgi:virginiamycin B lyase
MNELGWHRLRAVLTALALLASSAFGIAFPVESAAADACGGLRLVGCITIRVKGISYPTAVVADPDQAMWFTNFGNNTIGRTTSRGRMTIFSSAKIDQPSGIAHGSDGNLWFTNTGNNTIGRITTAGAGKDYSGKGIAQPISIVRGPDGALWFANSGNESIGRISVAGAVTNYPAVDVRHLVVGPDGALWFVTGVDSIGRMTLDGQVRTFHDSRVSAIGGITAGPDGALWFTAFNSDYRTVIGRITTGGVVSNLFETDPSAGLPQITSGPDGALWYTTIGYAPRIGVWSIVTRMTTSGNVSHCSGSVYDISALAPGLGSVWMTDRSYRTVDKVASCKISDYSGPTLQDPLRIAEGPDGALWLTNSARATTESITRVSTRGHVTNFAGPSGALDITAGLDGALWFSGRDDFGHPIRPMPGRITTDGSVTRYPDPKAEGDQPSITQGPDGALWFTSTAAPYIRRLSTDGTIKYFRNAKLGVPGSIVTGPDGRLWFTMLDPVTGTPSVGRMTTGGHVTVLHDDRIQSVGDIVAGPTQRSGLWFTDPTGDQIGHITTRGAFSFVADPDSDPEFITLGPDGAFWFSNTAGNSIGRITETGVLETFTSRGVASPGDIAPGPDHALWFINGGNTLGRISAG